MFKKIIYILTIIALFVFQPNTMSASVENITILSKSNDGVLGNSHSSEGMLSKDGNFVVFISQASNLVAGDTNDLADVFVYEIQTDTVERVSISTLGVESNGESFDADISGDGRYVVFVSGATNLVPGDTNGDDDIFVYDRDTNSIEIVSIGLGDEKTSSVSSSSDGASAMPSISLNGRYVVFESVATNLIEGDTNGESDIFIRDLLLDTTERVSITNEGNEAVGYSIAPAMSSDGRYVSFFSEDNTLVSGDTNALSDYFVRDLLLNTTERVNVSSEEVESNGLLSTVTRHGISNDGRYAVFSSLATNLVPGDTNGVDDIFVRDMELGTTERITLRPDGTEASDTTTTFPSGISSDGRYVSFYSGSPQFVEGDTTSGEYNYDVFVRDLLLDTTRRISLSQDGEEGNAGSYASVVSLTDGGRYAVFNSGATNFVENDINAVDDVFLVEISDEDGISSVIENAAPNTGDIDENGYIDSIEQNVSSFVNSVSGNYTSVVTTGDCFYNSNLNSEAESELASEDAEYDYPLGIISFEVNCREAGETATVSVYCFCDQTPVDGLVARKYDPNTGEYTTIDSAVIEEVIIDGQRALKMTYDVVDGGSLDEDGLSNGTIVDPVGFGRPAQQQSSRGSSSSGSIPKEKIAQLLENNTQTSTENSCEKINLATLMKKGSKFGEVSLLQSFLNKNGFNSGVVDGLFGSITDSAVKAFQKANNLISDGIVGPITRGLINSKCI